jgi:hypothetical protein
MCGGMDAPTSSRTSSMNIGLIWFCSSQEGTTTTGTVELRSVLGSHARNVPPIRSQMLGQAMCCNRPVPRGRVQTPAKPLTIFGGRRP